MIQAFLTRKSPKVLKWRRVIASNALPSNCSALWYSILLSPQPSVLIVATDLFQGCEIPGAGFGYVALQDIPKGTILLEDTPIFRLPEGITNEVVRNHLIRLPPTVQQQFMDLCIGYQYLNDGEYLGRFRANALPCGYDNVDGTGRKLAGLLLLAARFNHSCVPNVTFKWDSQAGVMRFCALSAISRAQELCIAYDVSSLLFTRDARRARLQGSSGFLCHCPACIIENRDSDDRRVALYKAIVQPPQRSPRETQIEFLSVSTP